jgi:uncharacterized protein YaaQ
MESKINWSAFLQSERRPPIRSIVTAHIASSDEENTINALNRLGLSVTILHNTDNLLHTANRTLLIGVPEGSENLVFRTIETNNTQRKPKIRTLALPGLPENTDETELFLFEIDRYIEL